MSKTGLAFLIFGMVFSLPAFGQNYIPSRSYRAPNQNSFQPRIQASWTQKLINGKLTEHDFGTVARASKQKHVFEFENTTGNDLFLTSVRTSCGCTKPKIMTSQVKAGGMAQVNAEFDTLNFYGKRGATLTVSVQQSGSTSRFGEIQFVVKGNIRRDVVLNPGEVVFGDVSLAASAQRTVRLSYAGSTAWQVLEIKSTNPNITAKTKEVERNLQTGRVAYDLIVNLSKEQAAGTIYDELSIITNDAKTSGIPFVVRAKVTPAIEVRPIQLGVINKGQTVKKKLILHSARAFSVSKIKTADPRIVFQPVEGEKTLHLLTYTLDTSTPGQIEEDVTIFTNDPGQPEMKVPFSVQIVPATVAGTTK